MNIKNSNLIALLLFIGGVILLIQQQAGSSPIDAPGFRVLIVYENTETHKLPKEQVSIFTSTILRAWLIEHCAKDADGTPDYQIFDQHTDLQYESEIWQDTMARPRESLPWLVVGNGSKGYEGPLPATIPETIVILERFVE